MISFKNLNVKIISRSNEYEGLKASNGAPFYIGSMAKDENSFCIVILYLPITRQQFYHNTKDYFYGLHFMIKVDRVEDSELEGDMMVVKHKRDISYDIRRIRFYPENKGIVVDKINDSMVMTSGYTIESDEESCDTVAKDMIHDMINKFINFYHGKEI